MPPSPTLFSTPRLVILENFATLPFYSRLPVYWFMCIVDSGSVKPRQSHKTVWCTCFFYKHDVFKHIQAQVWWFFIHMLSIMLSLAEYYRLSIFLGSMNFSALTMIFSVKVAWKKTFCQNSEKFSYSFI